MVKNYILKSLRLDKETFELLQETYTELGIRQTDLVRFLLKRALIKLKSEAREEGWDNINLGK